MIYTVTFNPALDYVMRFDALEEGETNRSSSEELYFGGKGVNVSAILGELDIPSTAFGFIAGFTGDALQDGLEKMGVTADFVKLPEGMTRINVKIKAGKETEINAQGPNIDDKSLEQLYCKLDTLRSDDILVLAGSVPGSLPRDIYEKIMCRLAGKNIKTVVDATGDLLKNVLQYKPFLVKPNHRELEELVGRSLNSTDEIADAAKELQALGAVNVLVSRGKDGALLVDEYKNVYTYPAIGGKPINTVGAGDSMVAGFIAGVDKGYEYALKLGSAAGGATACSYGLAKKDDIFRLLKENE